MILGGQSRQELLSCAVEGCTRPAGYGHFAAFCEPCSDLPYGAGPAL